LTCAGRRIHQGTQAASKFQKITDHFGVVLDEPIGVLANRTVQKSNEKSTLNVGGFDMFVDLTPGAASAYALRLVTAENT